MKTLSYLAKWGGGGSKWQIRFPSRRTLEMLISSKSSNITDQRSSGIIISSSRNKNSRNSTSSSSGNRKQWAAVEARSATAGRQGAGGPAKPAARAGDCRHTKTGIIHRDEGNVSTSFLVVEKWVGWGGRRGSQVQKAGRNSAENFRGKNTSQNMPLLRQQKEFILMLQLRQGACLFCRLTRRYRLSPSLSLSSNQSQIKKKSFPTGRKHLCHWEAGAWKRPAGSKKGRLRLFFKYTSVDRKSTVDPRDFPQALRFITLIRNTELGWI